ncbi:MAG: hypothetical protein M3063_13720 [Actinomycetota bacterium]|nr:hypothetical protein [Actinomycetota bacterium]
MPGEAGPVAAGALDPDHNDGPELAQPGGQIGVTGRGRRERLDAEQTPDRVEGGGNMDVGMSVDAASDGACLYDGHSAIPF